MIEIYLLIITACFVYGVTMAEARHDYWTIVFQDSDKKRIYPNLKDRWKFWGNLYELAWIVFFSLVAAYLLKSWSVLFWPPILWLIRTIFHDGFIALFLGEKFSYVSDTGFDGAMKRMCLGSGAVYLGVKIFILVILILSYISVKFNLDLLDLILSIFRK